MSEQGYERKKDFVNHALSRCVASMYPNVCRVAYHTRDTDEGLRETAMIYLAGGYSRRVDVTGLDLPATLDAVLAVFREAAKRLTDAGVLLLCPMCRGKARVRSERYYQPNVRRNVICMKCFTNSGWYKTEHEARLAWNTRAAILSAEEMEMLNGKENS